MHKATSSLNHFTDDGSHKDLPDLPDLRMGTDPQVSMGEVIKLRCDNERLRVLDNITCYRILKEQAWVSLYIYVVFPLPLTHKDGKQ